MTAELVLLISWICLSLAAVAIATWGCFLSAKAENLNAPNTAPTAWPLVSAWQEADKANLLHFLSGPTGLKLIARLRATEAQCAIAGASDVLHTVHSAGVTKGYGDALKQLLSLSSTADATAVKINIVGSGEALNDERLSEDEELLARLSP